MTTPTTEVLLLALIPAILWGFNPILYKRGLANGGNPVQAAFVVVAIDAVLYWTAVPIFSNLLFFQRIPFIFVVVFLAAGFFGTALGRIAVFEGVDRVGASVNSAGISTRPLFSAILALIFLNETVSIATILGIVILVVGLVVISLSEAGDIRGWRPVELIFPIGAAAMFGMGNVIRRFGLLETTITPLEAVTLNETAAFVSLGAYLVFSDNSDSLQAPVSSYWYFSASGLLTAIALFAFFAAFARPEGQVVLVDPLAATAPLFTAFFSFLFLRDLERVTPRLVTGAILTVIGSALVTL